MKTLTRIQADGLKNLADVDLEVPQFMALAGPNGSGKTALLQAIRLAVLGYEPELGKTLAATRQLGAAGKGKEIEIALQFGEAFGIRRTIGASMEIELVPPEDEATLAQKQARIERETGTFVPSFDLEAFLALSAEKRKEYLFALLPRALANLDEETFRGWLGYETVEPPVRKAIDKLWIEHVVAESSPIDGLASAIEFARARFLEAENARLGQVRVVESADRDAEISSADVDYDPDRLADLQAEIEVVTRKLGELYEQAKEAERSARRARERDHQRRVVEKKLEALAEEAERLEAGLGSPDQPRGLEISMAEAELAKAGREVERLEQFTGELQVKRAKMATLLNREQERLTELEGKDRCPLCRSEADLGKIRQDLADWIAGQESDVAEVEADLKETMEELKRARESQREAKVALDRLQETVAGKERLVEQRKSLVREVTSLQEEAERLAGLEVDLVQPPDADVRAGLAERAAAIRDTIAREQAAARQAGKAEAERERADRERHELERRTKRAEALKRLHGALQRLRAHVIEQMVGPVESTANELLRAIDPEKSFAFVFEREGRAEFDFGFEESGVFRSYDAASTGEDAFLAVVLVAALIAACQPAWPVLLVDNIESVDDRRRADLMEALAKLSDRVGNVLVAGCCGFPELAEWTVVDMEKIANTKEAVAA